MNVLHDAHSRDSNMDSVQDNAHTYNEGVLLPQAGGGEHEHEHEHELRLQRWDTLELQLWLKLMLKLKHFHSPWLF